MDVIVYMRVSTDRQDLSQQRNSVDQWLTANGLQATAVISDEGISGGVSYKRRKLGTEVLPLLKRGDILLVSELSRLGRSMSDISTLVNDELKPRGVRLVAPKSGYDIDTSTMNAQAQLMLQLLTFAAQMEKELIQSRTQSAIDVRQNAIKADGGFVSKGGRYVTKLGAPSESLPKARAAAAAAKRARAAADPTNVAIWRIIQRVVGNSTPTTEELQRCVLLCAERDIKTPTGKTVNVPRLRSCYYTLKKIYTV